MFIKAFEHLQTPLMNVFYVLYETFWGFIDTATNQGSSDYTDKIWYQSENVYRRYEIFTTNILRI